MVIIEYDNKGGIRGVFQEYFFMNGGHVQIIGDGRDRREGICDAY